MNKHEMRCFVISASAGQREMRVDFSLSSWRTPFTQSGLHHPWSVQFFFHISDLKQDFMQATITSDAQIKQFWSELNSAQDQFGINSKRYELAMKNLREHMKTLSRAENTYLSL